MLFPYRVTQATVLLLVSGIRLSEEGERNSFNQLLQGLQFISLSQKGTIVTILISIRLSVSSLLLPPGLNSTLYRRFERISQECQVHFADDQHMVGSKNGYAIVKLRSNGWISYFLSKGVNQPDEILIRRRQRGHISRNWPGSLRLATFSMS